MNDARLGRMIRVLRQRRGWRISDLAARAGVGKSAISEMERGRIERYTLATVRKVLRPLAATAELFATWGGAGEIDRLLDADHARLVQAWAERHRASDGWELWPEASYSIFGERGRIDLLAFHRPTRVLEVTECKSGIWDVQDTVGRFDAKIRLAARVAADRGWRPTRVVGALVVADGRTARRRVAQHDLIFSRFDVRGWAAYAWVRDPSLAAQALLVFISLPRSDETGLRRAGQRRVRVRKRVSGQTDGETSPTAAVTGL